MRSSSRLLALLALATLVRIALLHRAGGPVLDADEAIVGLMAKHINEGRGLPLYYYGQNYLGALEPWLVAVVFSFTGPSAIALRSVPAAFSVLTTGLVYALGRRVVSPRAGEIAALLFALPPAGLAAWSLKARGGFIELVAIGTATLLVADAVLAGSAGLGACFALGALFGLGWWVNQQIVYYALPFLGTFLWLHRRHPAVRASLIPLLFAVALSLVLMQLSRPESFPTRIALASVIVGASLASAIAQWGLRDFRAGLVPAGALAAGLADGLPESQVIVPVAALLMSLALPTRAGLLLAISIAGFTWWNPEAPFGAFAALLPPAFRCLRDASADRRVLGFLGGCVVGASPALVGLAARGRGIFEIVQGGSLTEIPAHLGGFLTVSLPMLIGARPFWGELDYLPGLSVLAIGIYAFALPSFLRTLGPTRKIFFTLFLVGLPLVFAASAFGWFAREPRYLLPLYSVLFLVPAAAADRLRQRSRPLAAMAVVAILLAIHGYGTLRSPHSGDLLQLTDTERVAADHTELISFLDGKGIDRIYTSYWIGYRLAFETGERIRFAPFDQPATERIIEYGRSVRRATAPAWVMPPTRARIAAGALRAFGIDHETAQVSGYEVLYGLEQPSDHPGCEPLDLDPSSLAASHSLREIPLALDEDFSTRWATHAPQAPGQWISIRLDSPRRLCWLSLRSGDFSLDYPRGLEIVATDPAGGRHTIVDSRESAEVRYWLQAGRIDVDLGGTHVSSLRIEQTGHASPFDWSIVELDLFALPPPISKPSLEPFSSSPTPRNRIGS